MPGRVSENIKVGALFPRLPTPSKVNLGLLTAKGSPNPPAKPLSGLAAMGACVSAGTLSPQANALPSRWPATRGLWEVVVFGRVTRENSSGYLPSWSCICFVGSSCSQGQLLFSPWFPCYLNGVTAKNSAHPSRAVAEVDFLVQTLEGGGLLRVESLMFSCRHKRWVSVRCQDGEGGRGRTQWVGGRYSQQEGLWQLTEGTHKSDEPVSKLTWNS